MGLKLDHIEGQTPIDDGESEGLLIQHISTKAELDEWEHRNIQDATQWLMKRKFKTDEILTESFVKQLHKKMYGNIWAWAGLFRKTEKNLGVQWVKIPVELKTLIDDCRYWIDHSTYPPDEIAIRLKHRIVAIHCFSNGNGRHSRLLADIVISNVFKKDVFTWGSANLNLPDDSRKRYLTAIKEADNGAYNALLAFSRQ